MKLNICVCGGGSLGTVCAGVFLSQGYDVNLLTGHPSHWNNIIKVEDPKGQIFTGFLNKISDEPSKVIPEADLILLCLPGYLLEKTLLEIKPFLKENIILGSIVSNTGFFFNAHEILKDRKDITIFGFQRVPFIARSKEYGKSADLLGYKENLKVAIEGPKYVKVRELLEKLFLTPTLLLENFYEASLSNSNPILHTGRLYALWKEYNGKAYDDPILFYKDWDNKSSEIVLSMDEEFMKLTKKLGISEKAVPSLKTYYGVTDPASFTSKIQSIPAFSNILAPMKKIENGWVPDFSSRYFTEDFPYGLASIKKLIKENNLDLSVINKVLNWGLNKCKLI